MTRHTPLVLVIQFLCIGLLMLICSVWSIQFWYVGYPFDGGALGAPDTTPIWLKVAIVITPAFLGLTMLYSGMHNLELRRRNAHKMT